jgi:SAM domain (Sterile alpha motif)
MDIVVWLRSLGLGRYEAVFRKNEIDETVLRSLTHETLKELGVTAVGHRLKLLDAITALGADTGTTTSAADKVPATSAQSIRAGDPPRPVQPTGGGSSVARCRSQCQTTCRSLQACRRTVKPFQQRQLQATVTIRPELKIQNQKVTQKWARTDCARDCRVLCASARRAGDPPRPVQPTGGVKCGSVLNALSRPAVTARICPHRQITRSRGEAGDARSPGLRMISGVASSSALRFFSFSWQVLVAGVRDSPALSAGFYRCGGTDVRTQARARDCCL